jgi:hypothetical protein
MAVFDVEGGLASPARLMHRPHRVEAPAGLFDIVNLKVTIRRSPRHGWSMFRSGEIGAAGTCEGALGSFSQNEGAAWEPPIACRRSRDVGSRAKRALDPTYGVAPCAGLFNIVKR